MTQKPVHEPTRAARAAFWWTVAGIGAAPGLLALYRILIID